MKSPNYDNVSSIEFRYGAYLGQSVTFQFNTKGTGASVELEYFPYGADSPYFRDLSAEEWKKLLNTLFDKVAIQDWKENYDNPYVMDGIGWNLTITEKDGTKLSRGGSNAYPENWEELADLFEEYIHQSGNDFSLHPEVLEDDDEDGQY